MMMMMMNSPRQEPK